MMILMVLGAGLALLLTVLGGAWFMRELFPHAYPTPVPVAVELSAREVLDRRFARGEVSREEYATMKDTLSDVSR
jgi:uncharacterized membrane protein